MLSQKQASQIALTKSQNNAATGDAIGVQLLARGELECTAIDWERWERLSGAGEYAEAAQFEPLESSSFSLNFDWKQNKIKIGDRGFVALRIKTSDILKHREFLLPKGKPKTLNQFGSFFFETNIDKTTPRPRRGRPHQVNWDILKEHLAKLVQENLVPVSKESCIYELISFAEKEFGKCPSRSSVQRNLNKDLDLVFAQK